MIVISRCSPNSWQQHHRQARDALRSATKGERTCTSIWDRWQSDEIYRNFQLSHCRSDTWVRFLDTSTSATMLARAERTICESASFTKFLTRASRQDHCGRDQRIEKRKRNCQVFSSQQRKKQVTHIQASDWKREQNRLDPSLQEYLEWLSMDWAEKF